MLDRLVQFFAHRGAWQLVIDALDIIVVAVLIYRLLLVLKGTRAAQMGFGLLLVFLTYVAARYVGLVTLQNVFSGLLSWAIVIIVVVFQNDIRRALMRIGSNPLLNAWGRALETRVIDEVVAATTELARHRIGAIIAFEQDANLNEFVVGQGINIDSAVTRELLVTMFVPESVNKLHDGAVIIRNLRVARAGVFFPMPESRNVDPTFGSRHRAAIGITDETDAVVVVVSEERGTISFCFNGNIVTDLDGEVLRKTLLRIFGRAPSKKSKEPAGRGTERITTSRVAIGTPPPPRASTVPRSGPVKPASTTPMPALETAARSSREPISTPLSGPRTLITPEEPGEPR